MSPFRAMLNDEQENMARNMDHTNINGAQRKASIKETGEELTQEEWARFDAAVEQIQAERRARQAREYVFLMHETEGSDAR